MNYPGLPERLLESLEGVRGYDRPAFEQVHASGAQVTSIRYNPLKFSLPANGLSPVPWSSGGYYLPQRPSFVFDPLFHAGVYYVQEASGMFLEEVMRQTTDLRQPLRVLDLCAAPGGKSTLLQSILSADSLLVSNEVIKSRATILEENMTKWGGANVIVTNNDPRDFQRLENFFDVIVIDAPCSGSGLFRRDPGAVKEWSDENVQLCHRRQQRILTDVFPALKENGVLIYSTCSYSREEDEDILDWLADAQAVENLPLSLKAEWQIVESTSGKHAAKGYRFFPDKLKGEGFFIAAFRKKEDGFPDRRSSPKKTGLEKMQKAEMEVVKPWLDPAADLAYWKQKERNFVFPAALTPGLLAIVSANLYIRKAGLVPGKIAGRELIPDHALAMSGVLHPEIVAISLKKEEALQYLRREEVNIETPAKGWSLVQYEGVRLGWIKVLPNRINNYYPKEWRILKI